MQILDVLLLQSFNLGNKFCTSAVAVFQRSLCWQAQHPEAGWIYANAFPLHLLSPLAFHLLVFFPFFTADHWKWVGNGIKIQMLAAVSPIETIHCDSNDTHIICCLTISLRALSYQWWVLESQFMCSWWTF